MRINGAAGLRRLTAFLLTAVLLMTTCFTSAWAENMWDTLTINVLWTDGEGVQQSAPALAVQGGAERSYWVSLPAVALNQRLTVEALSPNPAYYFYFEDEVGGHTTSFTWLEEMDAQDLALEYAYQMFFTVNGTQADQNIYLYVSSMPMPEVEAFVPFPVNISVKYVAEDGTVLDSQTQEVWAGQSNTLWAASAGTAGYELVGAEAVEVYVDQNGVPSQTEVIFTYRQVATPTPEPTDVPTPTPVAAVSVPVAYYHVNGDTLAFQELMLAPGTHAIQPEASGLEGYELVSDSVVYVTVYPDGALDPQSVVFTYQDVYVAPAEATIEVYYVHEDGTVLDVQQVTLTEGTHNIGPASSAVAAYELTGAKYAEVTVYADGSASASRVQFTYKNPYTEPVQAQVEVRYIHLERGILHTETLTLGEGVHTVEADGRFAAEYLPVHGTTAEVTVYADGSTHPGAVEFYYEDAYSEPVTAKLTVIYQLADGTVLTRDTMTLTPGTHIIEPDASKTAGYALAGGQSHIVYVDENGVISPETVSFVCRQAAVTVAVHYQDDRGRDVAPVQYRTFEADGVYAISAAPEGLSSDYELAPGQSGETAVTVSGGKASQSDVYFYYQLRQEEPASASVTVGYFDTYGNEIAKAQTVTLETGVHQLTPDHGHVPSGYELASDAAITVEVYENGTFSPQEVAFYYRQTQAEGPLATVTVYYKDDRGKEIASSQTLSLSDGTHVIKADPADLPAGYVLFSGMESETKVIVRNGVPTKTQVVFYYQKTQQADTVFTLPVYYYDTLGNPVATTQYVQIAAGTYNIQASPADLPQGYELMMDAVQTVVVNADGSTDPEEIAFYYRAPEKKAAIIVNYVDESGRAIADPFTLELATGYHNVKADASRVPSGYDPDSATPVQVYVSREGEASPAQVTLAFARLVYETPIPVGETVYRYANVTGNSVALRSEPSTSRKDTVLKRVKLGAKVYVLEELYNDKNEVWARVIVDGQEGYMMSSFLEIMTQEGSDAYAAGSTPAPTFTPEPTASPTPTSVPTATPTEEPTQDPVELITPPPTEVPTLEPLPTESATPTASPSPTPSPAPYTGYALTTRATALRTGISSSDMTIMQNLAANELVSVVNQVADPVTGEVWSIVSTLNRQAGFVPHSALRLITDREAEPYLLYWQEQNKTPEPTELVTATPEPIQLEGYGVVLGDEVPFRQMASEYSRIIDNLAAGTIVYITGQTLADGQYWHSVNYEGYWGYIRTDLVRMLTIAEEEAYLDQLHATPTPEPVTTNLPFDANGLSSYGYVDGSSVNWRQSPSVKAQNVEGRRELKRYAFCLVLGTEYVNGVTWYKVSYGDQTGYLHGDFFRQMTISELEEFLGSDEYLQGIASNSSTGTSGMDDVGYTGTGGIVSAEDQWVNKNQEVYASFAPFNPIATVAPIQTTPTLEPLPGWTTEAPTATPTATPTFNPLPDVTYPTSDNGEGGNGVIWVVVLGLLLLAVGGAFALVRYQQNRRRIAMRAAQRRAQAARAQQMQQRPYARTTAQGQPRTGTYPNQQTQVRRPVQNGETGQYTPYSGQYSQSSYQRPADAVSPAEAGTPQRTGRRTAYRQAQQAAQQADQYSVSDTFDA